MDALAVVDNDDDCNFVTAKCVTMTGERLSLNRSPHFAPPYLVLQPKRAVTDVR